MAGNLQPLVNNQRIVNPDGTPTEYFIRWAQQKQIDISGGITADEAAALIASALTDYVRNTRQIIAGIGLDGGGNLSTDVTIDLSNTAVVPGTYGDAMHVPQIMVDAQGRLTSVASVAISGGGGGGAYAKIAQVRLAAAAPTISFNAIPATHDDLVLTGRFRTDTATLVGTGLNLQFNGDTAAHYDEIASDFTTAGLTSSQVESATAINLVRVYQAAAATVGYAASFEAKIIDYASSGGFFKQTICENHSNFGPGQNGGTDLFRGQSGGLWRNNVPITDILLKPTTGNFAIGTVMTLWGR